MATCFFIVLDHHYLLGIAAAPEACIFVTAFCGTVSPFIKAKADKYNPATASLLAETFESAVAFPLVLFTDL